MKRRQDGWVSEYRRKKFLARQKNPSYETHLDSFSDLSCLKIPTMIAIMLDLDGTVDGINDEKASAFIKQLDYIRKKFKADIAIISISTHHTDSTKMKKVLDILAHNLIVNIKIGLSFYYGGTYDYESGNDVYYGYDFNWDKVSTFDNYYLSMRVPINKWFAIIDDEIDENIYLRYKDSYPMLLCQPSKTERVVSKNNFMRRASCEYGFDGVLDGMDSYITSIDKLSPLQILDTQKNMIPPLSSFELMDKFRSRDYSFLERYFKEGYALEDDYEDALSWILLTNSSTNPSKEELIYLERILAFIIDHFQKSGNEKKAANAFQLQKKYIFIDN